MDNEKKIVTAKDYDNVIRAAVTKFLKIKGYGWENYEDFVQQMWIEVLKEGEKLGKTGNLPDLAMIPQLCKWRLGDIFKKLKADNDLRTQRIGTKTSLDAAPEIAELVSDEKGTDAIVSSNLRASIDRIWPHLNEKEKEYFKFWIEKTNIEDFGFHPQVPEYKGSGPRLDGYQEDFIAKRLGFPSGTAASYRNFRQNFRKKVSRYLGTLDN